MTVVVFTFSAVSTMRRIFASTQFTKQHYISDVISGVVLALLCYSIAMKTDIARPVRKVFERINEKVFGDANEEKKEGTV